MYGIIATLFFLLRMGLSQINSPQKGSDAILKFRGTAAHEDPSLILRSFLEKLILHFFIQGLKRRELNGIAISTIHRSL